MRRLLALGLIASAALPAAAQDVMTRDAACKPHVTVRHQECSTATYYLCPGEGGETYRAEIFHGGQPTMVGLYDTDYNMIGGSTADGMVRLWAEAAGVNRPLSLAQLRAEGRTDYVETIGMDVGGTVITMTNTSTVVMRPDPVTLGGVEFRVADLHIDMKTEPFLGVMSSDIRLFLNDGLVYPVEGRTATTVNGMTQVTASDPVEIILPGQPDFGTVEPRPGCGPAQ